MQLVTSVKVFVVFLSTALLMAQPLMAQTGPSLLIQPSGTNQVQIGWAADANFNVLEEILAFDPTEPWREVPQAPSIVGTHYLVTREATNGTAFYRLATHGTRGVSTPPDPATTAPAVPANTFIDHASSTAFLYTGPNAVQIGVAPGTISPVRASVLRGKVKKRDSSPLPGVRVAILNHPEFGYTFTRTDGMFDLAVNASLYTLDFQAIGYCPVQRQETAPNQDFRTLKDVVMVGMDPIANPINFGPNAPAQIARSSVNTDKAGTRSVSILFPAGTCANLVMPDGSTQGCGGLTIRATEFTVGTNGPAAMPAPLPPSSAYTYCAEFSGDEAVNAGARTIQFNQTVWGYLDNFLQIPVGVLVPSGSYDRQKAAWVPENNGLVIKILGVSGGLAQVDLDGSGVEADSVTLAANQFTTTELQQLAANYGSGKTLWRMPMAHFTSIDWNFGGFSSSRPGASRPGDPPTTQPGDKTRPGYGTINFSSQIFEEALPLVGVPMALHYSSARVPDYHVLAQAVVPLVDIRPPDFLKRIEVHSQIAGVVKDLPYITNFLPSETATLTWDGYDAYGRYVGGSRDANIEVDFIYDVPIPYGLTGGVIFKDLPIFGNYGQFAGGLGHADGFVVGSAFTRTFTIPDHRTLGLGGWSLTPHHLYDPQQKYLYLGNGTVLKPDRLGNGVGPIPDLESFAGASAYYFTLVAAAPDGTVFFLASLPAFGAYGGGSTIRFFKRSPDGQYAVLSGAGYGPGVIDIITPQGWAAAEGKSALLSDVGGYATAMKAGSDGSLYFRGANTIGRIDPQGILRSVQGPGPNVYPPDGTLARDASSNPSGNNRTGLAVGRDGTVYYDDYWNINGTIFTFIRKIAPDGRIYTIAGQGGPPAIGESFHSQFGQPASTAHIGQIRDLAVGPDGTIYVSPEVNGVGIYKITTGGTIESVLWAAPLSNVGYYALSGLDNDEGVVAAEPFGTIPGYPPYSMQIGPDGSLVFLENYGPAFVWRITPDGILQRVAGRWNYDLKAKSVLDSANPLETTFGSVSQLAIGPDGSLTLVYSLGINTAFSVQRIGPSLSGFTGQELQIPSEDATEVYVFDAHGTHLRTLNGLSGTTNWLFSYNAQNLVTDLRDANGLNTHIERNAAGQPTAIVGPYGQRTTLALDGNGFLSGVSNPASETTLLSNTPGGLLSSITGPRNHAYNVTYDADGRVAQVRDPLGGGLQMGRTDLGARVFVGSTNSVGDAWLREMRLLPSGDTYINYFEKRDVRQDLREAATYSRSGGQSSSFDDGSIAIVSVAGDPRFPQTTRVLQEQSLILPGGLVNDVSISRTAQLTDVENPFSVAGLTNLLNLNGQNYTNVYNGLNGSGITTSPEGRNLMTTIDEQGRLLSRQRAGRARVDFVYDSFGHIIKAIDSSSSGSRTNSIGYDALGQLSLITDSLGRTASFSHDAAGRLSQVTMPGGSAAAFAHDSEYHLTSVTPPGRPAHSFQYDAVGALIKYTPPQVGIDESVGYQYDTERKLIQVNFPDGQAMKFQRGDRGRIDLVTLGAGPVLSYQYSASLQATNISSTTGDTLQLGYTGPILTSLAWSGAVTGNVVVQLNADLLAISKVVNGSAISYAYDRDRLLTNAGNMSLSRDSAGGKINATALGAVTDQRQFDERGLLTNYVAKLNGAPIWSISFGYDLLDRLTDKVETVEGVTRRFGYGYDAAGRLEQVLQNGALVATYTYDANGNRLARNGETATYDAQDRITSYNGATFAWSPNGDLKSRTSGGQTTTYAYDVRGVLTSVALPSGVQVDYVIDANGHRLGKKVNGTLQGGWLWDGLVPVAAVNANSSVTARFVYGEGTTPTFMISGTNTYRILSDERGSVRLVVNVADGTIAQQLDYDEFGRVLSDTAPGFQPFGFAGGFYDPDTGLARFGLRDYSSETGRWTARDPFTFAGGDYSLYAYVRNNPLNLSDPLGAGPFGLKTRAGAVDAVYDELFDGGKPKGGNDAQLQQALDAADQQLKDALKTGAQLTYYGALANVAVGTFAAAASVAPLGGAAATSSTAAGAGATSVESAAATTAASEAGAAGAVTAAPAVAAAPAAVAPTATAAVAAPAAAATAAEAAPAAAASEAALEKVVENSHLLMQFL